jgi:hypothetical protein
MVSASTVAILGSELPALRLLPAVPVARVKQLPETMVLVELLVPRVASAMLFTLVVTVIQAQLA